MSKGLKRLHVGHDTRVIKYKGGRGGFHSKIEIKRPDKVIDSVVLSQKMTVYQAICTQERKIHSRLG